MSEIFSAQLAGVATLALAILALATGIFAGLAFWKQSREVRAIEQQVKDGRDLASQQADLLKVQSGQLELQRQQLEDQRAASARQTEVLELQATELRESLAERKQEAEDRQRSQAARVTAWFALDEVPVSSTATQWRALIRNASPDPVFNVRVYFYLIHREDGGGWAPVALGGSPPSETIPVLPPTADRFVNMPDNIRGQFGGIPVNDGTCMVTIEFTDAAGNRWERDPRGSLNARS